MKKIIIPSDLKSRKKTPTNKELHTEILEIWKAIIALSENQNDIRPRKR